MVAGKLVEEQRHQDIDGPYPEGARFVRSLVGAASVRAIARKSGVSYTSVHTLIHGGRLELGGVIRFALAYRVAPNRLLQLFGFEPLPELDQLRFDAGAAATALVREKPPAVYSEPDHGTLTLRSGRTLDLTGYPEIAEILEQLARLQERTTQQVVDDRGEAGSSDQGA